MTDAEEQDIAGRFMAQVMTRELIPKLLIGSAETPDLEAFLKRVKRARRESVQFALNGESVFVSRWTAWQWLEREIEDRKARGGKKHPSLQARCGEVARR